MPITEHPEIGRNAAFTLISAHIVNYHVLMCWCPVIEMVIIQMCHKVNKSHSIHIDGIHIDSCDYTVIAKFRLHQMTGASQRASRESARIQINNLPPIFHFFFLWIISFCFWHCMLQNHAVFFTTKTQFLSVSYSITDTNNSVLKNWNVNKGIIIHITTLLSLHM